MASEPKGKEHIQSVSPEDLVVVGLGEALFDCFPTHSVLGGAPVNFALHASALLESLGGTCLPATRVGKDELGDRFFAELRSRNVSTDAVQIDHDHPTGQVIVELDAEGQASYNFASNVAWDHLAPSDTWDQLAKKCCAVAFGTLAQRSPTSRETITRFLSQADRAIRLFDVNLRGDFYSAEMLDQSLRHATALKLNLEELEIIVQLLDLKVAAAVGDDTSIGSKLAFISQSFELDWVALTRGAEGTLLYCDNRVYEASQKAQNWQPEENADSVGAGDACCASLLVGMLLGWPPQRTLELANQVGAFVASRSGATPQLPESLVSLVTEQTGSNVD